MIKKIKQFLTKLLTSTKRFLLAIPYRLIFILIIEASILLSIAINIKLIMLEANSYLELLRYSIAIIALFALGYAIYKKDNVQ